MAVRHWTDGGAVYEDGVELTKDGLENRRIVCPECGYTGPFGSGGSERVIGSGGWKHYFFCPCGERFSDG